MMRDGHVVRVPLGVKGADFHVPSFLPSVLDIMWTEYPNFDEKAIEDRRWCWMVVRY